MRKKATPEKALVAPYAPTPHEREVLEAQQARKQRTPPTPRLKVEKAENAVRLTVDHPDEEVGSALFRETFGTSSTYFAEGLVEQLANACMKDGEPGEERALNVMLSMVKGIEPKDPVEAMLAAQMVAVHNATMTFARRLNHVTKIPQQDSAERAFNKLARTFAAQVEALKRYRTGGEQRVTVEHVTVHEGGQAIVGNVTSGGRGPAKNPEASS